MSEPTERFYPPLAVGDESHTFTDAESSPNPPAFIDEAVRRQADADFAKREAEARAVLTERVFAAMREVRYIDYGEPDEQGMAEAAVEVFVDFLRNPPVREHHDGYEVVRWPGGEDDVIARYPADEVGPLDEYRGQ